MHGDDNRLVAITVTMTCIADAERRGHKYAKRKFTSTDDEEHRDARLGRLHSTQNFIGITPLGMPAYAWAH